MIARCGLPVIQVEGDDANWLVVHAWDEKPSTGLSDAPYQRSCTGGVSCGSAPGQVNLNPGAQTTVNQSYSWKEPGDRSGPLTRQSPPR